MKISQSSELASVMFSSICIQFAGFPHLSSVLRRLLHVRFGSDCEVDPLGVFPLFFKMVADDIISPNWRFLVTHG